MPFTENGYMEASRWRTYWRSAAMPKSAEHPNEVVPYKILPTVVDAIRDVALSRLKLFNNL